MHMVLTYVFLVLDKEQSRFIRPPQCSRWLRSCFSAMGKEETRTHGTGARSDANFVDLCNGGDRYHVAVVPLR